MALGVNQKCTYDVADAKGRFNHPYAHPYYCSLMGGLQMPPRPQVHCLDWAKYAL